VRLVYDAEFKRRLKDGDLYVTGTCDGLGCVLVRFASFGGVRRITSSSGVTGILDSSTPLRSIRGVYENFFPVSCSRCRRHVLDLGLERHGHTPLRRLVIDRAASGIYFSTRTPAHLKLAIAARSRRVLVGDVAPIKITAVNTGGRPLVGGASVSLQAPNGGFAPLGHFTHDVPRLAPRARASWIAKIRIHRPGAIPVGAVAEGSSNRAAALIYLTARRSSPPENHKQNAFGQRFLLLAGLVSLLAGATVVTIRVARHRLRRSDRADR
jgi:hypothetical protein